jgi:predicted RND superfamily exporter protein
MSALLAGLAFRWRFPLSAAIVLGAVAFVPRANITTIDNDITAWFSRQDPVYRDYERFRQEFGGTRWLIVALEAASPDVLFSRATLQFIQDVAGDIERVDTVQRVDSLANATIVDAVPDGLDVRPLLDRLESRNPDDIRRRAVEDDLIRGDLVSEDGTVTALIVSFDEDRIDAVRAGVIQRIHDIVDPRLPAGMRAYYNGSLEISETYNRITLDNQRRFTPPILVVTLLAIYLTFRSLRKTVLSVIAIAASIFWTLGLYSLMGFSYNVLSSMIVPLIVVLAIADDVHIMQHWDEERRDADVETAFKRTVAHLCAPLLGASATTALGMLSLATSEVVAVRTFGIGSAVGIMVDFAISLVLVPTLLSLVKPEQRVAPHERFLIPPLRRVAALSTRRPRLVLTASVLVGLISALGILWLRVDTNHINFFSRNHPISESAAVIDRQLAGVYSFQIMLEGPPESLRTPDALRRLDTLSDQLRRFQSVRKVTSVADYVKRINKELNDGKPEASVIPADADTISQELFVFALGGEGRHELERIVASDYSRAQINIKLQSMSSDVVLHEVERADALAKEAFAGTGIAVMTTGSGRLFSTLDHYLVASQMNSFTAAFFTVFGVIFVVFRSARFGLLAIVPNVLPVLAVLGVMGYLGISMNIATVMVASIALGVVDDDTIHFINRYRHEIAAGADTDRAIEVATTHEGRASLTTALINSCGYGVLLLSEYKPTAWFGGLLALTMAVAFLAEVFILPATIKLLPRIFGPAALLRRKGAAVAAIMVLLLGALDAPAAAQVLPTGHVSTFLDYLPNRSDTLELRARAFAEEKLQPSPRLTITASGFAEGLLAHRPPEPVTGDRFARTAIFRVHEASLQYAGERADVLFGVSRVVWGRLDELQPTDVVNPLDVSRFFFEGRSEARMPVALVRGRLFLGERATVEAVYVPIFRKGRFDQLDEETSPFNVAADLAAGLGTCLAIGCPTLPPVFVDHEPPVTAGTAQGGLRVSGTTGRVDWSIAGYRGYEPIGLVQAAAVDPPFTGRPLTLVRTFPRFTMIGGDFETVRGEWGLRGEIAAFVDDNFQLEDPRVVRGSSIDAGLGVDRKAGDYRLSATVLYHGESYDIPAGSRDGRRRDVSLIAAADRSFARERYMLRTFAVVTPSESSAFLRTIATVSLWDNVAVEGSGGWFAGDGDDFTGRFAECDFAYLRLKYYF